MSRRLVITGVAVVVAAGLVVGGNGVMRVLAMRRELHTLEADVARLRTQAETLSRTVDRLRNDPAYMEKVAREELGYVRQGETVLKFPSQGK